MAALPGIYDVTSTMSTPVEPEFATNPGTTSATPKKGAGHRKRKGKPQEVTAPEIDPLERGDEEERNRAQGAEADELPTAHQDAPSDVEAARMRSELAKDLVHRVDQLVPLIGDVGLATGIQFLRRDLSRCHDLLREHPTENDFLSIVILVESAMAQLKWKQYNTLELDVIRQALDIGYRQVQVGFDDYQKARTMFAAKQVAVTPRMDLESLKWEDIKDDEQDEATTNLP